MPMPTAAKKKLGAIGLFRRHSAASSASTSSTTSTTTISKTKPKTKITKGGGRESAGGAVSQRQEAVVSLPPSPVPSRDLALSGNNGSARPKDQSNGHVTNHANHSQLPQLEPPPEIVSNPDQQQERQDTPATARSGLLPRIGRYASMSARIPAQEHFHPMQRTRTSASDSEARDPQRTSHAQNAWEDSTVASMFNDAASDRTHTRQASNSRRYNEHPATYQRQQRQQPQTKPQQQQQQQQQEDRPPHPAPLQVARREKRQRDKTRPQPEQQQNGRDESLPFVIDEGGLLKVIPPAPAPAPALNTISSNISNDGTNSDDRYQGEPAPLDTPSKNGNGTRRSRLPYRNTRDYKSAPYSPSRNGDSPTRGADISMPLERAAEAGESLEQVRMEERRRRDHERQRERDREIERQREREAKDRADPTKRSTIFADLDSLVLDDPSFDDTRAAVAAPPSGVGPDDMSSEVGPSLRSPRTNRRPPPAGVLPLQIKQLPIGRSNSRHVKEQHIVLPTTTTTTTNTKPKSLKRRFSLDYNDAELHAMSFSDLKNQAFDYDPQTAALEQTAVPPAGGTIEERMDHYKTKGSIDQHQFFTRMTVDEWDEAGDWFLEQFSAVVQKIKKARKAKRTLMTQFEDEISAREEAVRGKIEGIGRTLDELKQEGQTMMEGKDMDLDF